MVYQQHIRLYPVSESLAPSSGASLAPGVSNCHPWMLYISLCLVMVFRCFIWFLIYIVYIVNIVVFVCHIVYSFILLFIINIYIYCFIGFCIVIKWISYPTKGKLGLTGYGGLSLRVYHVDIRRFQKHHTWTSWPCCRLRLPNHHVPTVPLMVTNW